MPSSSLTRGPSDRAILYLVFIPLLALNIWCGVRLITIDRQQAVIKEDFAEANSIRHGLLSVDVWKGHIKNIAAERISKFQLSPAEEEAVRGAVEKTLNALVEETDQMMRKPQKTFRGKMRKLAFKVFVDTETLSEQTPEYAQAVMNEVRKPANLEKIKNLALTQIEEVKSGEASDGNTPLSSVLAKYNARTVDEFNDHAGKMMHSNKEGLQLYTSIMIGSLVVFLSAWWGLRLKADLHKPLYALSVALAFIVLLSALALPMIDIDARIRNIDFLLMGEHLRFANQLLFYRSKSIMQMVKILIESKTTQTVLVGFLIFLFSIIFPVAKLFSALLCVFEKPQRRSHALVRFFAYQSGKWSMADVMVVAIFMAYIGFNGVLNGQLKNLNFQSESVGVISTNETTLQPGFILFLSYVLFSLALSSILKKILPHETQEN